MKRLTPMLDRIMAAFDPILSFGQWPRLARRTAIVLFPIFVAAWVSLLALLVITLIATAIAFYAIELIIAPAALARDLCRWLASEWRRQ